MTSTSDSARARTDLRSYRLDDDLVLLDEARGRLVALNATAAFVWVGLTEGVSPAQLAAELSDASGIPLDAATGDVEALLDRWRSEGLLTSQNGGAPAEPAAADGDSFGEIPSVDDGPGVKRVVQLLDSAIDVVGDAGVAAIVDELFGHALIEDAGPDPDRPLLRIPFHDGQWLVIFEDTLVGRCGRAEELPSVIYGTMLLLTYETTDCFAVFHAAAVATGTRCILMPGESGSGKSTLTAALIAAGYDYCTDDLAVLTDAPVRLRPVPLLIGLKDGSWPGLASRWPELDTLPVHQRNDGKRLKYLSPGGARRSQCDALAIAALVIPVYRPGAKAELRALARSEALVRTTRAGYDLADSLDDAAVRLLIAQFRDLPCYELQFDDLSEAVDVFSRILPR